MPGIRPHLGNREDNLLFSSMLQRAFRNKRGDQEDHRQFLTYIFRPVWVRAGEELVLGPRMCPEMIYGETTKYPWFWSFWKDFNVPNFIWTKTLPFTFLCAPHSKGRPIIPPIPVLIFAIWIYQRNHFFPPISTPAVLHSQSLGSAPSLEGQ